MQLQNVLAIPEATEERLDSSDECFALFAELVFFAAASAAEVACLAATAGAVTVMVTVEGGNLLVQKDWAAGMVERGASAE
jgi:hypothetical protein